MSSVIPDNWSVKSQEEISLDLPFRCDSLVHVKKKAKFGPSLSPDRKIQLWAQKWI